MVTIMVKENPQNWLGTASWRNYFLFAFTHPLMLIRPASLTAANHAYKPPCRDHGPPVQVRPAFRGGREEKVLP